MSWKKQKKNVYCCGQLAVSIILHKSLKDTIFLFGHSSYTKTSDLVKILRKNKIKCDNRLKTIKKSELAIAKLTYLDRNNDVWHWVVVWKNKIFDGLYGKKDGTVKWKKNSRGR